MGVVGGAVSGLGDLGELGRAAVQGEAEAPLGHRDRRQLGTRADQLIEQRARNKRARDEFKIRLGVPTTVTLRIRPGEPEVIPVDIDLASAVAAAKNNRLDLRTQRQRLELNTALVIPVTRAISGSVVT